MTKLKTDTDLIASASQEGDVVKAAVRGDIDLHNSPELRSAFLDVFLPSSPKKLILDLSGVPYMDSSAIAVLVEALQKMRRYGGKVYLTNLQPRVRGLLEIARLDTIFILVKDEQEAMNQ